MRLLTWETQTLGDVSQHAHTYMGTRSWLGSDCLICALLVPQLGKYWAGNAEVGRNVLKDESTSVGKERTCNEGSGQRIVPEIPAWHLSPGTGGRLAYRGMVRLLGLKSLTMLAPLGTPRLLN